MHDELAVVLSLASQREQATAEWRAALALMSNRQSGEEFFAAFDAVVFHLGKRSLLPAMRPEIESVLRPYFARNGNFRSNELLEAIYKASLTPAEGTAFIIAAANFAADPNMLLEDLRSARWLVPESRETILLRQLQLARDQPPGEGKAQRLRSVQSDLVDFYPGSQRAR